MSLTPKQKSDYLVNQNKCPYCQSEDIEGTGEHNTDDDWHENAVECNSCGKTWYDVYTISDIREEDEEEGQPELADDDDDTNEANDPWRVDDDDDD